MRQHVEEEQPSLARSLADGLREQGYAVDLTFDGDEARHLALVNPYDAIILDIMLPKLDGWQVLKAVRARKPTMPVLCLTARDGVEDRVKGLDLGADDYLAKPFAWDEFLARVRSVIRRGHGQASSTIKLADMEIDLAKKAVTRGGRTLALSAREFALLEYLAHRQGQVVSRSEIWDHLYDQHDESISNVVDVYIGYLRGKIDKGFEKKLIHTRRGQGYVLGEEE
jgi:two-component system copper resistance phosphate regulon response regulator CusR